jgi:hypothetical protein
VLVTCLATHALTPGFGVGDRTGISLQGPTLSITLTTRMRRNLAQAIRDGALRLDPGPDELDLIVQDVEARWQALTDRIELRLYEAHERRAQRSIA